MSSEKLHVIKNDNKVHSDPCYKDAEPGSPKLWYKDGLRFKCTGCGQCCTGAPGHVWVTAEEIADMAAHVGLTLEDFVDRYVRQVGDRYSLKERSKTYSCVFLKDNKCSIYMHRPQQCRTFPWWQQNIQSLEDWQEAAKMCEGIDHPDAPVVSLKVIQEELQKGC